MREEVIREEKRQSECLHLVTREARQVASGVVYKRREEVKRKEGSMIVIAPGDKRRQVASGVVYKKREAIIRGNKRLSEKRRDNESDCTW